MKAMKAKLVFRLPKERKEFYRATKATDMYFALYDISQLLYQDHIEQSMKDFISDVFADHGIQIKDME